MRQSTIVITTIIGLSLAVPLGVTLGVGVLGASMGAAQLAASSSPFGGAFNSAAVPNGWGPLVAQSATRCPEITAPLIAAQIEAESNWDPDAVSPAGAQGLAQFIPSTWATYGTDGDGDGVADPYNPADAIISMGVYDCALVDILRNGGVEPTTEHILAAYNAGPGAVIKYGGIPPYEETQTYVRRILSLVSTYGAATTPSRQAVIAAAQQWLGTPYSWGGGGITGPTTGIGRGANTVGFDCSSLMQYAFYHGAGMTLPRTTRQQVTGGQAVSREALAPGDVVYFARPGQPVHHVGLWLGNGRMLHAPSTGDVVKESTVSGNSYWEGMTWYPRRFVP